MTKKNQTTKVKRVLTPEQMERLISSRISDAARRCNPDPRQAQPVSDEDMRSLTGRDAPQDRDYGIPADRDGD